ncbi:hypothetical protein RRG08_028012 [Elysia crispata]|uniref:Uncharacterized protein n=1 Tax=Elysia crispata TaxID=231223 RepID=A0AAE1BD08_9GAST|nr:hypothetical protein RRG08_028012 [Elysia crispata]
MPCSSDGTVNLFKQVGYSIFPGHQKTLVDTKPVKKASTKLINGFEQVMGRLLRRVADFSPPLGTGSEFMLLSRKLFMCHSSSNISGIGPSKSLWLILRSSTCSRLLAVVIGLSRDAMFR